MSASTKFGTAAKREDVDHVDGHGNVGEAGVDGLAEDFRRLRLIDRDDGKPCPAGTS